jgi:hypothetical protein
MSRPTQLVSLQGSAFRMASNIDLAEASFRSGIGLGQAASELLKRALISRLFGWRRFLKYVECEKANAIGLLEHPSIRKISGRILSLKYFFAESSLKLGATCWLDTGQSSSSKAIYSFSQGDPLVEFPWSTSSYVNITKRLGRVFLAIIHATCLPSSSCVGQVC